MKPNDKAIKAALRATSDSCSAYQIQNALDAAYAAQFQSEDYAGLLKMLRSMHKQIASAIKQDDPWGIIDETVPSKAADALEAVLAERDRLNGVIQSYQILLETQQGMHVATQTERDALFARLAPVEDEALVEIVAVYCSPEMNWNEMSEKWKNSCRRDARAAIAAIRPHIEAAERERCARIAEGSFLFDVETWLNSTKKEMTTHLGNAIAAAIRSGK